MADNPASISVVPIGKKKCKPFILEVMVFAPEAGFKFEVFIEKSCSPQADAIWKLVFDLFKKKASGNDFDQIVHVSYKGDTPVEQKKIQATGIEGVNEEQSDLLITKAFPAIKELEGAKTLPPEELTKRKEKVKAQMRKVVEAQNSFDL